MKTLFTIILVALLAGCEGERITVFYSDPELRPYVNSFFADAEKYKVPVEKRNLIVVIGKDASVFTSCTEGGDPAGSRIYNDRTQWYVEINPIYDLSPNNPGVRGLVYGRLWELYYIPLLGNVELDRTAFIDVQNEEYHNPLYPCYSPSEDYNSSITDQVFSRIKAFLGK